MRIDLHTIIETYELDKKLLAKILFPKAVHPDLALTRLISKRSMLNEKQIYFLSTFTGISVGTLYEPQLFWKATTYDRCIRFTNGEYTALYDPETGITKILMLSKEIAIHTISNKVLPLSEYLKSINQIIIKTKIQTS